MAHDLYQRPTLTADLLLRAYAAGIFPMSESRNDPDLFWVDPQRRGIIPLNGFHISRSLARRIRAAPFDIRVNTDFKGTVAGCADRDETWINAEIFELYQQLHAAGYAHSMEVWDGPVLVGGVYGVTLGAAFFGESMFSRRTDASKIALAYLVSRLRYGGFQLFDTQFVTDHLIRLGAVEIPRAEYHRRLERALDWEADFLAQPQPVTPQEILHLRTQTS
ncbi:MULTISPECIES: leucyl/phenylalanyl-tRNA--protein transferase [Paracoccaceae]|jgi:leucyl/phenylalanyl-tRNA--protein transferase|uniref:leucyl/phenylalanyl-tRNA--protein transferase n=1 Tax=Rhodobacterales TaxID=204455 RepID=UPI001B1158D7|nr:leucyl/phenylalanyl-tRNA--protein transferase [Boseongicola sp. H5]MBO6604213.1 leucyl/phenylalanyl-tRNA--protein transferase [Roseicyclus sp.]MBO6626501.1 leucyl/phenylalanyl-tRNA--protein transferase [Roseicyclus sp.]MBO6923587.1 leucyl/phenylalanyl-tRNA--protein transferase [Roseicyclus sp.]